MVGLRGLLDHLLCYLCAYRVRGAAMIYGIDTLAGAKYPKVVRSIPNTLAVGFFAETFGDAFPVVQRELESGRCKIRVHLLWSDSHSFGDRDIPKIRKLARKYQALAARFPGRVEISPFCEHNLSAPDKYLDIVAAEAPAASIVNTPWKGAISRKYKNEVHGDHKAPNGVYNYSYDGTSATDANVEADKAKHSRADIFFIWSPRLNLKWSMKDATPRPQRKAIPSPEYIDSLEYLAGPKGETSIPKNWLVKSHAERHEASDTKGDKLLIISPLKSAQITLKRGGKVVATLPYYGPFDGGGHRFYAKAMGFQIGVVEVWQEGKKFGVVNCGFRDPTFR